MSQKKNKRVEKEECDEEEPKYEDDWHIWTDPLEELSEIEDAFEADDENRLHGKTILDVGTDCVKPLYIALRFEPDKIVGIDERLYLFAQDLAQKSKLFTQTDIQFYDCSLFDDEKLQKTVGNVKFDFVLVSKTLHHLRTGKCILRDREGTKDHKCRDDEKCCVYEFKKKEVFERLFGYGKRVIVYECFYPHEKDKDKVRGRGGHFTVKEWRRIFEHLSKNYRVEMVEPLRCHLDEKELEKVIAKLRQVDCICFYVEKINLQGRN